MRPRTLLRTTALLLALSAHALAQTVLWSDDFESGASAWTTTGLWHLADGTSACLANVAPFPSGTGAMWYGAEATCNFNAGHTVGLLTLSAPLALPAVHEGGVTLRYRTWREAEVCGEGIGPGSQYDWTEARVLDSGGATLVAQIECTTNSFGNWVWRKGKIDLTPYLGTAVRVAFSFDSVDDVTNHTRGLFVDDVSIELEAGVSYCETLGCPCPGQGAAVLNSRVGGCRHSSQAANGAELRGAGTPRVSADDVVIRVEALPASSFVTFLQGSVAAGSGTPFGDGRLCLTGSLVRLAVRPAVGGAASYPAPGEEALSLRGAIPAAGATVGYQAHYRDSAPNWCTPATFNTSNGYRVVWIP